MIAAFAVLFALTAVRSAGFLRYLTATPSVLDAASLRSILAYGIWPLLLALGLWAIALGLGRRALRGLRAEPRGPLDSISAAALGLGLLGQAVFLLGWWGGLRPAQMAALVLAAAAVSAGELRLPALARPRLAAGSSVAAGLLAFAALFAVLTALAPPLAWDVRAYHLAIPELGLRDGRWSSLPWLLHAHWPHLMEALYALPLAAGQDGAAALLHAGAAGLLVGGVFLAARRPGGNSAAWAAALLLAAQPVLLAEAGTAHSDAAAALFAFAAAHALARWDETGSRGWLAAAGALAGLGAASKLTLLAMLAGWALWLAARRRPRDAAVFLGAGILFVGPWLLKSWLETGDPAWPLLSRFLGHPAAAALAARNALSNRWGLPPPLWMLTEDGPGFLLVPLAGLWALSGSRRAQATREERWLLAGAPLLALGVFRQHAAWRYLLPLWPALALAAGRAAAVCFEKNRARAAAACVLLAGGAVPIVLASPNNALFGVLAPRSADFPGADRRELFTDRSVDVSSFYRQARGVLPPGARVLLFREIRGYGAGFDYVWGDPMNQAELEYGSIPGPDALLARLKALRVGYVLDHPGSTLYRDAPGYYDPRTLALMAEALRRGGRVVLDRGDLVLYQLL
jgi:hypothetical protein